MSRISEKFRSLGEHPLIGYAVAGYPDLDQTLEIVRAMVKGGVDILELGIPFSDPIADGQVIQRASYEALKNNVTPKEALDLARKISDEFDIPIAVMTYCNILYRMGYDNFLKSAKSSGVDGVIIPDLTIEESDELVKLTSKYEMDLIFLVSPNTTIERIRRISRRGKGFLYLVSVYGTTGEREGFEEYTLKAIRRVKRYSSLPLAVGFGVSKGEHARMLLDAGADAVIVGSAFINLVEKGRDAIEDLARSLKEAMRSNKN